MWVTVLGYILACISLICWTRPILVRGQSPHFLRGVVGTMFPHSVPERRVLSSHVTATLPASGVIKENLLLSASDQRYIFQCGELGICDSLLRWELIQQSILTLLLVHFLWEGWVNLVSKEFSIKRLGSYWFPYIVMAEGYTKPWLLCCRLIWRHKWKMYRSLRIKQSTCVPLLTRVASTIEGKLG